MTWSAAMAEAQRLARECPKGRFVVQGYWHELANGNVERRYEVRCAGRRK